jgi:G3E family GTPase
MQPIPLVLIAGFLGAGKTTFLQDLLQALELRGIPASVIINDFENAAIDAARLRSITHCRVETLDGACVCCSSLEEFLGKMATIEVPENGVLLVEANGTSDYITLIAALAARPEAKRFMSPLQVTMIDASRWQKRLWHNRLEKEQVNTATHWQLRHVKEGTEHRVRAGHIRSQLQEIAPGAVETDVEQFARFLGLLSKSSLPDSAGLPSMKATGAWDDPLPGQTSPDTEGHTHHHHEERAFTSMVVNLPAVVHPGALKRVLDSLPDSVLRVKGVCRLSSCPDEAVSIQHVRPEVETWCVPLGPIEIDPSCVIVGVRLPVREIRSRFASIPDDGAPDQRDPGAMNKA